MKKRVILAVAALSLLNCCSNVELVPMTNPDSKASVDCRTPMYNDFWGPFASDLRIENECIAACRRHGFRREGETAQTAGAAGPATPLSAEAAALTPEQCKP